MDVTLEGAVHIHTMLFRSFCMRGVWPVAVPLLLPLAYVLFRKEALGAKWWRFLGKSLLFSLFFMGATLLGFGLFEVHTFTHAREPSLGVHMYVFSLSCCLACWVETHYAYVRLRDRQARTGNSQTQPVE